MSEDLAKLLTTLIAFGLTFVLASLSYRFVENPILSLKDRYFGIHS